MKENIESSLDLDNRAVIAKQSKDEMDRLICDFMPFLRARVARHTLLMDATQREEMLSMAMMAFYEAIQNYAVTKGHFFPFARNVVHNRIIDHLRHIYRKKVATVSLDEENSEKASAQSSAVDELSIRSFEKQKMQEMMAEEIEQFKSELNTWGITLDNLGKASPKHKNLRETYQMIVEKISLDPDIVQTIQLKRYLPIKAIAELTELPQKKIERARTFILAILLIKHGDYDYLSNYINYGR
jgi:RNA polymerase sigma factor